MGKFLGFSMTMICYFQVKQRPSSKTHTCTRPFMAIDLLGNSTDVHRYRHDLESLFYALVYITARYHNGKEIDNPPSQHWDDLGKEALKSVKIQFLNEALPKITPEFLNFIIWIESDIESGYYHPYRAWRADANSYSGHRMYLSFDAFRQILAMNIF